MVFKTRIEKLDIEYQRGRFRITEITTRTSAIKAQAARVEDISEAEAFIRETLDRPAGDLNDLLRLARTGAVTRKANAEAVVSLTRQLASVEQRLLEAKTADFSKRLTALENSLKESQSKRDQLQSFAQTLENSIKANSASSGDIENWVGIHVHGAALGLQDGKCPLCSSAISETEFQQRLNDIKQKVEMRSRESAELLRQRSQASEQLRRLTEVINSLERQFKDSSSLTEILQQEKTAIIRSMAERGFNWPENIDGVMNILASFSNKLREEAASIEKSLAILEGSRALGQVAELEKELAKCQSDSEALARLISKARSAEERFKEAAQTVKRLSGELVDERLAELSPLLTELYTRLKPHVDWTTVSYITRGDVRRFLSLRVGEDLNPRFMFSNGQRRAAGLAFLLAVHLSRSWCRLDSLVLDDPVQHIDDFRALHLVEVLSAIRQTGRQIICTIEDPELAKLLCRRLRSLANQEGVLISLAYQPEHGVKLIEQKSIMSFPKTAILAA